MHEQAQSKSAKPDGQNCEITRSTFCFEVPEWGACSVTLRAAVNSHRCSALRLSRVEPGSSQGMLGCCPRSVHSVGTTALRGEAQLGPSCTSVPVFAAPGVVQTRARALPGSCWKCRRSDGPELPLLDWICTLTRYPADSEAQASLRRWHLSVQALYQFRGFNEIIMW